MRRARRRGLTALKVANARPDPDKRIEIPDPDQRNLYLVVQPSGSKSFAVRYRRRRDGKPRKLTLGAVSLGAARKLAQEAIDKAANGGDPASEKRAEKLAAKLTPAPSGASLIEDAFALYLDRHTRTKSGRPIRLSSKREVARLLGLRRGANDKWVKTGNGVLKRWSGRSLDSISRADVRLLVADLVKTGPVAANRSLSALKAGFAWLVKQELLQQSPAAGIDKPSPESPRERVLSDLEMRALWSAASAAGHPYGDMVRLLILCGVRKDEARCAVWAEFNLADRVWEIPGSRTKNGNDHVVPLSDAALALVESLPRIGKGKFVFSVSGDQPATGVVRAKRALHQAMTRELGEAPAQWGLHDLRRSFVSGLQRLGYSLEIAAACVNHKSGAVGGVTSIYARHRYRAEKEKAFTAWAAHISALVEGGPSAGKVVPLRRA